MIRKRGNGDGKSRHVKVPTNKPLFDYDGDDFYAQIRKLAMQGGNDRQIASGLRNSEGFGLGGDTFCAMKNGKYALWTKEENARRSARIKQELAQARESLNAILKQTYLKVALGRHKTKNKATVTRHLVIDGVPTENVVVQETETDIEYPPNMQAIGNWLYHHDPEWRKIADKKAEEDADVPQNIEHGIDITRWIDMEVGR